MSITPEPLPVRLRRRAVTIPAMVGATVVGLITAPAVVVALAVVDLIRGRRRLPSPRIHLFGLQYALNDTVEIVLIPVLRLLAIFDGGLGSTASLDRHRRLQLWSVELLARRARQLLGLRLVVDEESRAVLGSGPLVVISRHASLFDASLPGLLLGREGLAVRGVIMAELLADPGFDLLYQRLGSIFIPRDDGPAARAAVTAMASEMHRRDGDRAAVVLFPEGRLYRPELVPRLLSRLAERDPERARRLAPLRATLPPRPTGFVLLASAMPEADVVLVDHRGLDRLRGLGDLRDRLPIGPVTVTARRHPRVELPRDADGLTAWLDQRWLELDAALAGDAERERPSDGDNGRAPNGTAPGVGP